MDLMHFSHSRMNQDGLVGTHGIRFQDGDTWAHRLCERKRRRGHGVGGSLSFSKRPVLLLHETAAKSQGERRPITGASWLTIPNN